MNSKDIKSIIKSSIYAKNFKIKGVIEILNSQYGYNETSQNLSNRLKSGTIKYKEVLDIAEITGYDIKWVSKDSKL